MQSINLALQGGGSHGAFTWGVLDKLLEDGRLNLEGISGTSAGAMNAVALAHGLALGEKSGKTGRGKAAAGSGAVSGANGAKAAYSETQREAARAFLAKFWGDISALDGVGGWQRGVWSMLLGGWNLERTPTNFFTDAASHWFSPYQTNPLDINPLRAWLEREIDFERLAAQKSLKVFVSATRVSNGKAEIFSGKRLTAQAVMASACLPMLFQAVEIEGEHYWDGGYSGNPALHPLIYQCDSRDIVLVQINPLQRDTHPSSAAQILDRINELTFNASLLAQMRAIDFVKRMLAEGRLDPARYKDVLLHRIDGGEALEAYPASSKMQADAALIKGLFELGRTCAQRWLSRHFEAVGRQSTVNIARDYLDDMRMGSR
jgi:NTE family protein